MERGEEVHRVMAAWWWLRAKEAEPGPLPEVSEAWIRVPDLDAAERTALLARAERVLGMDRPGYGGKWWAWDGGWNRDPTTGRSFTLVRADRVRYRGQGVGDVRALWEVQRHHHLVWLAQGWALTGQARFREALADELDAFLEDCPFPRGPAWTSALEVAVRLANWAVAWQLAGDGLPEELGRHWAGTARAALGLVRANLSTGSSANNHLVGELGGLVVGGSIWDPARVDRDIDALGDELLRQIAPEGSSREGSPGYLAFVLSWGLLAGAAATSRRSAFLPAAWERLAAGVGYLRGMTVGGAVPRLGDWDDGCVVPLGSARPTPAEVGRLGAALLGEGTHPAVGWCDAAVPEVAVPPAADIYEEAGHVWLGDPDGLRVFVQAASIGEGVFGGHAHADVASVLVWWRGEPLLVDRGTGSYLAEPRWRAWFRGTAAHNTVTVDERSSARSEGAFLWHRGPSVEWEVVRDGGEVTAVVVRHDGFARKGTPVMHERRVVVEGDRLLVEDTIHCEAAHDVALHWHLPPGRHVAIGGTLATVQTARGAARFEAEGDLEVVEGGEHLGLGWHSPVFGRWEPAPTLRQRLRVDGTTTVCTVLVASDA